MMPRRCIAALTLAATVAGCRQGTPVEQAGTLPAAGGSASDAALASEPGTGDLLATWVAGDSASTQLFFSRSSDRGASWSAPVRITSDAHDVAPTGEASPRIVAAGRGRIAVAWPRPVPVPGRQWPASAIRVARSHDGGRTWSAPVTVNDDTASAPGGHNFHGAAWVGDSGIMVAWLDERHGDSAVMARASLTAAEPTSEPDAVVYTAFSPDFGVSWEPNRPVWGAACPCCRVTLARMNDGGALAAWRQHYPGNIRDVVIAPVAAVRSEPVRVHRDDWVFPGCPHAGPAVAIGADGSRHVVWYTGRTGGAGMYYARIDSAGRTGDALTLVTGDHIAPSHAAAVALGDGGALAAYDAASDGSRLIGLARIGRDGRIVWKTTVPGSAGGRYPQLAQAADGTVLLAWTGDTAGVSAIRLARIPATRLN